VNENENHQAIPIDDSNVHLQLFFQNLEQLLQVDLKSTKNEKFSRLRIYFLRSIIFIK